MVERRNTLFLIMWLIILIYTGVCEKSDKEYTRQVVFLTQKPKIDGILDRRLTTLPIERFSGNDNEIIDGAGYYRMAYSADFLYLYIELAADSVIFRDRGYQNGDGFLLVLTKPGDDVKERITDKFYVLGFSATKDRENAYRKIVWYHDKDLAFKRLGEETLFEHHEGNGIISYELLLPWKEVYPYHPWISSALGFNLVVNKAMGNKGKEEYAVVKDNRVGSEQSPRKYDLLKFQTPSIPDGLMGYALSDGYCREGGSAKVIIALLGARKGTEKILVKVESGEGEKMESAIVNFAYQNGLTVGEMDIPVSRLYSGGYRIVVRSQSGEINTSRGLTVLPDTDFSELKYLLEEYKTKISAGSYTTIQFKLKVAENEFRSLSQYSTCASLRMELTEIKKILQSAERGNDAIAAKTGIFRRAFRSETDGSLQPYTVKIPRNYDSERQYPLLVYLHGSGEDDQKQLNYNRAPEGFIQIAPLGRGTSNCFSTPEALADVREAINDVMKNYSIDEEKIILAGFSMGGYGVYRIAYEMPRKFKAVAVFSGHPDLANLWLGEGKYPNFLNKKNLEIFKNKPIFISHGEQDRNIPYSLAVQVSKLLKDTGACVEFHPVKNLGHNINKEIYRAYFKWLWKQVAD